MERAQHVLTPPHADGSFLARHFLLPGRRRLLWATIVLGLLVGASAIHYWRKPDMRHYKLLTEGGLEKTHIAVLYFVDDSPRHDLAYLADDV